MSLNNQIILSICIPTYNRADCLKQTIQSIVCQKRFIETNDVEIVISDNCSNDDTGGVSSGFIKEYGGKIRYYKNDVNIHDRNFKKVLSYGKGLFLKLNGDTMTHLNGSLDRIIKTINENKQERNVLVFSSGILGIKNSIVCNNLDSFVEKVSYWSTWIGCFGIWKEDFDNYIDFNKYAHLQLVQTAVLFNLISNKKRAFINDEKLFQMLVLEKKGGCDLLTVFLENYIFLLTEQLNNKKLTEKTFISEKRKLLLQFIYYWLINIKIYPNIYYFESKNSYRRIIRYYRKDLLTLIKFIIYYNRSLCYKYLKKQLKLLLKRTKILK